MTDRARVRDWLFNELSVESALDRMERDGLAVRASSDPRAAQRVMNLDDFPAPVRRAAMEAPPVYLAFFCLETNAEGGSGRGQECRPSLRAAAALVGDPSVKRSRDRDNDGARVATRARS